MALMKAQSAIEYLMTYGWMLLVVAIAGGAIFSIVGDQNIEDVSGFTGADLAVEDFGVTSGNSLNMVFRNSATEKISISKVVISDSDSDVSNSFSVSESVDVADTVQLGLGGLELSEGVESYDIEVIYDSGGLKNLSIDGSVTGSFDLYNYVDLKSADYNRSTSTLNLKVKNVGSSSANSINFIVGADNDEYTGSISDLAPGESKETSVLTDDSYSLMNVSLNVDGNKFTDSKSDLKCLPKEIAGHWRLDENDPLDSSNNKFHGSISNDVVTDVGGKIGRAYRFDGNNDYVEIDNNEILSGGSDANISAGAWFKTPNPSGGQKLIEKQLNGGNGDWGLSVSGGELDYYSENGGGVQDYHLKGGTVNADEWHHGMFTLNQNDNTTKIYLDGELVAKDNSTGLISANTGGNVYIGARFYGNDNNKGYFTGTIDDARVYNRSLSKPEIKNVMSATSASLPSEGCTLLN